jgi:hypothetical protein
MRKLIFFIGIIVLFSCKSSKNVDVNSTLSEVSKGKYIGSVSHQYKDKGCKTVVIIKRENQDNPLILIPMNDFPLGFDKDKMKISFDYLPLKVKNPEGCNLGIPIEIRNIAIEK